MHAAIAALIGWGGGQPLPNIEARFYSLTTSTAFQRILGSDPRRLAVIVSSDATAAVKVRFGADENLAPAAQINTTLTPLTFTARDHFVLPQYPLYVAAASGTPVVYVTELRFAE